MDTIIQKMTKNPLEYLTRERDVLSYQSPPLSCGNHGALTRSSKIDFLSEVSRMGKVIKMRYWIHGKIIASGAPNGDYFVEITRDSPIRSEGDLRQISEELSASMQATDDRGRSLTVKVQILAFSLFAN